MPGASAEPVCSCAHPLLLCARDRGCSAHPAFPAPSVRADDFCTTRAHRAAGAWSHIPTSLRAKRSNPLLLFLLHDGLLRFARNDGSTTELSWLFEMMERTAPMPGHTPPRPGRSLAIPGLKRRPRRYFCRMQGVAGELGFEPRQTESESVVLPLHHSPIIAQQIQWLDDLKGNRLARDRVDPAKACAVLPAQSRPWQARGDTALVTGLRRCAAISDGGSVAVRAVRA